MQQSQYPHDARKGDDGVAPREVTEGSKLTCAKYSKSSTSSSSSCSASESFVESTSCFEEDASRRSEDDKDEMESRVWLSTAMWFAMAV